MAADPHKILRAAVIEARRKRWPPISSRTGPTPRPRQRGAQSASTARSCCGRSPRPETNPAAAPSAGRVMTHEAAN
jgi:hypothetical protein